ARSIYKKLGGTLDLQYRYSDYDKENIEPVYDVNNNVIGTTSLLREDKRYIIRAELNYTINRAFDVYLDYAFTRNTSTRQQSEYDRSVINLGVNWYY
ncbi:outer membrane beta-barrel protein, partial [Kaarinaea lacus]